MKITIECKEEQAQLIVQCLESCFRFMMPQQSGDLVNFFMETIYEPKTEENEVYWTKHFDNWIEKRRCAYEVAKALQNIIYDYDYYAKLPKEAHRISDIWSCLRHELYITDNHEKDSYDVRSHEPIQLGDFELPIIKIER